MCEELISNWRTMNLKSLDLVLCSGNGRLSKSIKKFQRYTGADEISAEISHIAGIRLDVWNRTNLQESTTLNKYNGKTGVQENPLELWLPNYDGKVWVRQLEFDRTQNFNDIDFGFWNFNSNFGYEHGIPGTIELLLCGLRLNRFVKHIFPNYVPKFTTSPHCSELESKRLQRHKLYNKVVSHNRMPPWMWWAEIDKLLVSGCTIGKPVRIK